jgi:HPr Serine kinase C-terminal domain
MAGEAQVFPCGRGLPGFLSGASVSIGPVPRRLAAATAEGVLWQVAAGRFLLDVPGQARFLVEAGQRITIDPAPGADPAAVMRLARMSPAAALAWQRGLLAFHGAAVSCDGAVVLLAGESAIGKSSLAAMLLGRGWRLLCDEVAVVERGDDGTPVVVAGSGEMVLWNDVLERLGADALAQLELERRPGGRHLGAATAVAADREALRTIWWLGRSDGDEIEVQELVGARRILALSQLAYNTQIAAALVDRGEQLLRLVWLSERVALRRLRRPRGRWTAQELADMVTAAHPALTVGGH